MEGMEVLLLGLAHLTQEAGEVALVEPEEMAVVEYLFILQMTVQR